MGVAQGNLSPAPKTVAVIGGGFTGSLFALKLAAAKPDWHILLVEETPHIGRGVAYGACGTAHLLNVPVNRMEVGLEPKFAHWLQQRPGHLSEALEESGGKLGEAFVPRQLFGDYLAQRISAAIADTAQGIRRVSGRVVMLAEKSRQMILADGRVLPIDIAVLATGNASPGFPVPVRRSARIIANPWEAGILSAIPRDAGILLIGSGLTMIDVALTLQAQGHAGPVQAVSRHGQLPRSHRAGGTWPFFLDVSASPMEALRSIRGAVRKAQQAGIPWQRVFDAVRPSVASIWHGWSLRQRRQFLRHLRALWDVHRHRMADRIAVRIRAMAAAGRLTIKAARLLALDEHEDGVTAVLRPRRGRVQQMELHTVINCTGPQPDIRKVDQPLLRTLLEQGLVLPDPLHLGLESEDCAIRRGDGAASNWLYALGALTRPAWWEIVAVPEINAQIDRLIDKLSAADGQFGAPHLAAVFLDMGAGI